MRPSLESVVLHWGECFYTGLAQSIVAERLGSADAHQHCREAVTSAFPRPFLHVLYHFCSAKWPRPLMMASYISLAFSVIEIGLYFGVCQVPDRHQCKTLTTRKQKMKYHFFSSFIFKKCLISSYIWLGLYIMAFSLNWIKAAWTFCC